MKTRIISASIAVIFGIGVLLLDNKWAYITVISVFSVLGVHELLTATKYSKNRAISILSFFFVAVSPFIYAYKPTSGYVPTICFIFVVGLFSIMLAVHKEVNFSEVCTVSAVSICIPLSLYCAYLLRSEYGSTETGDHGVFCIVFTLSMTFFSDGGAYFIGRKFGKHKMAPEISPKKSWEGFFGGLVTSGIGGLIFAYVYEILFSAGGRLASKEATEFITNKPVFIIYGIVIGAFGVLGDLSASMVKRYCSIKDFGNIMPGHGGFLDRFDSALFTLPLVYNMFMFMFPISLVNI